MFNFKKFSPSLAGFLQTIGIIFYCTLISLFFQYAGEHFPDSSKILISIFMLMLLVISAAITGSMVFGYPAYLTLDGKIKKAILVLVYTMLYSTIAMATLIITLLFTS